MQFYRVGCFFVSLFYLARGDVPLAQLLQDRGFKLAIRQNASGLRHVRELVNNLSDPTSAQYGKWLTLNEVAALTRHERSVETVAKWASDRGWRVEFTAAGDFAHVVPGKSFEQLDLNLASGLPQGLEDVVDMAFGFPETSNPQSQHRVIGFTERRPNTTVNRGNAPPIMQVAQGDGEIILYTQLLCSDGSAAMGASDPCGAGTKTENPIIGLEADMKSMSKGLQKFRRGLSECDCRTCITWIHDAPGSLPGLLCGSPTEALVCVASFGEGNLVHFEHISLSLHSIYSSGESSDGFRYRNPLVPAPYVTPDGLVHLHGAKSSAGASTQAVVGMLGQYYSPLDARAFTHTFGYRDLDPTIDGFNDPSHPGPEATADVEFVMGVSAAARGGKSLPTVFTSLNSKAWVLDWAMAVANTSAPASVQGISYNSNEDSETQEYLERANDELMKITARGITVVVASGDYGVSGTPATSRPCQKSVPVFPATSPYVLAVGAAQLNSAASLQCNSGSSQKVGDFTLRCDLGTLGETNALRVCSAAEGGVVTGGGGFSEHYSRPQYQDGSVSGYIAKAEDLPPSYFFHAGGRAYPDIALPAHNFLTFLEGSVLPLHGTSVSTPLAVALLSLLNAELTAAGHPVIGFANPLLYHLRSAHPEVFADIQMGDNKCLADDNQNQVVCCSKGFSAAEGWDPASGLGAVRWDNLKRVLFDMLAARKATSLWV